MSFQSNVFLQATNSEPPLDVEQPGPSTALPQAGRHYRQGLTSTLGPSLPFDYILMFSHDLM